MASSQIKPANSATVTKDALYLFELLRESPDPMLIKIGPYAAKKGLKPNSIIKRLAGIKARNGLNISTTLGKYERPSPQESSFKAEMKNEPVKMEHPETHAFDAEVSSSTKLEETSYGSGNEAGLIPFDNNGIPTPDTSPSGSISSTQSFYGQQNFPSFEQFRPPPFPLNTTAKCPKRAFEESIDFEPEYLQIDGRALKKVRAE